MLPIITIDRDTSIDGGSTKFPDGLSDNRYIIFKIYDTSAGDPNIAIVNAASGLIDGAKAAFSGTGDALSTIATSVGLAGNTVMDTAEDLLTKFDDLGNPALAEIWKDNLYLPLPNELAETLAHGYSEEAGFAQSLPIAGGLISGAGNFAKTASSHISKGTGRQALIYNENKLAMFTGSEFRTISLSWTLIANNPTEAKNIQTIITKLKAYSSPQAVAGKMLLRAPYFVRLDFPNKIINQAMQFKETVMTGIEVNYAVSGHMETFVDDMPKTISLSITFKDREPKTLQAWARTE